MSNQTIRCFSVVVLASLLFIDVCWAKATGKGHDAPLKVAIRSGDGGQQRSFHRKRLEKHFAAAGCVASIRWLVGEDVTATETDLEFSPEPLKEAARRLQGFRLLAQVRTIDGKDQVAGALLAHASRAIDDPAMLVGETIAFVSSHSQSGYRLLLPPLAKMGVMPTPEQTVMAGSHAGSVAMLLHHEVAAAAVAAPLADEWSRGDGLAIILKTPAIAASGWWIRQDQTGDWAQPCQMAISTLSGKLLKPFPAWIGGFVPVP